MDTYVNTTDNKSSTTKTKTTNFFDTQIYKAIPNTRLYNTLVQLYRDKKLDYLSQGVPKINPDASQ